MDKIKKDSKNKMIFGVCGGISKATGVESSIIRLGFVLGTIFTGSILLWIYLLLAIMLPIDEQ
jgi:phage shock protein PspC (stress-responsive transcriptional regulator)